jgi:1-acyl-sn-glycerol-3-phosphate acyltransferase
LAVAAVGIVGATLIIAPFLILVSFFPGSDRLTFLLSHWWSWLVARSLRLAFSVYGADKVAPGQSYIVTPNHQSNADIIGLLLTLPVSFRWVQKKELLKIPLFGWAIARTGAISLNRADKDQSVRSLREGTQRIEAGW